MHFWIFHAYVGVFCAFEHFWFTVLGTLLRESQRVSPESRPSLSCKRPFLRGDFIFAKRKNREV